MVVEALMAVNRQVPTAEMSAGKELVVPPKEKWYIRERIVSIGVSCSWNNTMRVCMGKVKGIEFMESVYG